MGGPPRIPKNGIAITSDAGDDKTYKIGDTITVSVTFSENVYVTNTPQLTLKVGSTNKVLDYNTHASANKHLFFGYVVAEGDLDADGISIDENQLSLGSFTTIKDSAGNAAVLTHPPLTAQGLHKVDAVVPTVTATAITSSAGTDKHYKAGDTIQTTVTFSENVYVTGTPQVTLNIGEAEKVVDYTSGSGTDTLVFEYTVVTGDTDPDGVSMDANQLALNGATLKDYASNPATLTHPALARQADHKVDTTAPSLIPTGGI